jgi:hypothetical protein
MRRVLQPGGKLIFLELGLSPEAAVRRWQKRWEPAAHWLFEGLCLTPDMPFLLVDGGLHPGICRALPVLANTKIPQTASTGVW